MVDLETQVLVVIQVCGADKGDTVSLPRSLLQASDNQQTTNGRSVSVISFCNNPLNFRKNFLPLLIMFEHIFSEQGQPDNRTTGQPDNRTTGQPDNRTTGQRFT